MIDLDVLPTGYIYSQPHIDAAMASGSFADPSSAVAGLAGTAERSGLSYFNLTAFAADYLRTAPEIAGGRPTIDLGADGVILQPLGQQTGICDGCSFGEGAFLSACAQYAMTGTGPKPVRFSFAWAYLAGRSSQLRGDSGAIPSLTSQTYHDFGALPIGPGSSLFGLPPHGSNSEESACISFRDNPSKFLRTHQSEAADFKTRVYAPSNEQSIADCLTTGRAVTYGASWQAQPSAPGTNGVSSLYRIGGHETCGSGWFKLKGRLGLIKTESWWNANGFPGAKWPNHRVTIQTDDGMKVLYPGQSALWADEWMDCRPECWAVDAPGSGVV